MPKVIQSPPEGLQLSPSSHRLYDVDLSLLSIWSPCIDYINLGASAVDMESEILSLSRRFQSSRHKRQTVTELRRLTMKAADSSLDLTPGLLNAIRRGSLLCRDAQVTEIKRAACSTDQSLCSRLLRGRAGKGPAQTTLPLGRLFYVLWHEEWSVNTQEWLLIISDQFQGSYKEVRSAWISDSTFFKSKY